MKCSVRCRQQVLKKFDGTIVPDYQNPRTKIAPIENDFEVEKVVKIDEKKHNERKRLNNVSPRNQN